jgi:hypothetical protein
VWTSGIVAMHARGCVWSPERKREWAPTRVLRRRPRAVWQLSVSLSSAQRFLEPVVGERLVVERRHLHPPG